jgi:ELWxxDGT repeat protein
MQVEELEPRLALSIDVSFYDFNQTPTDDNEWAFESISTVVNNKLYYTGVDKDYGRELFQLDLSTMVSRIIDINPGVGDSITLPNPQFFTHGDFLFFAAGDDVHGREVRWIDTSLSHPVIHTLDVNDGPDGGGFDFHFASYGSRVFFAAYDDVGLRLHWVDTDSDLNQWQTLEGLTSVGRQLGLQVVGDKLFFEAYEASIGTELHWIDLTSASVAVNSIDINPGGQGSLGIGNSGRFATVGSRLFFLARDSNEGRELRWLDAGLAMPEVETIEHAPGDAPFIAGRLTAVGTQIFFPFEDSIAMFDASSPDLVTSVHVGSTDFLDPGVEVLGTKLFFVASDDNGTELKWMETAAPTPIVHGIDLLLGPDSSRPNHLRAIGEKLYFSAIDDQLHWLEIVGDQPDVQKLKSGGLTKVASDLTAAGNRVFFVAEDDVEKQVSLKWVSAEDEFPAAQVVNDFAWTNESSRIAEASNVVEAAGKLFGLTYAPGAFNIGELRSIDLTTGAPGGEVIDTIRRSISNPIDASRFPMGTLNNLVFYTEPLQSDLRWFDASSSGPVEVHSLDDWGNSNTVFSNIGDKLYFASPDAGWGWIDEEFSGYGLPDRVIGISRVGEGGFVPVGDKIYFSGSNEEYGQELRWIDATEENPVAHTVDVNPGAESSFPGTVGGFALAGNKLYFTAFDETYGNELRWIDVTAESPVVYTVDINPGAASSDAGRIGGLYFASNKLFFTVNDGSEDPVFWLDTTVSAPTIHALNIVLPWEVSHGGSAFAAAGERLFVVGNQLRWLDLDQPEFVHAIDVNCGDHLGRFGGLIEKNGIVSFSDFGGSTVVYWIDANQPDVLVKQVQLASSFSNSIVPPSCGFGSNNWTTYSLIDESYFFTATRDGFGRELVSVTFSDGAAPGPDLNQDGKVDVDDIDLMQAAIASSSYVPAYDVNVDGELNLDDRNEWLQLARDVNLGPGPAYLEGDANLDGSVNGIDFVIWNNHKFTSSSRWSEGDFDASGAVNGIDFVFWNNTKFQSIDSVGDVVVEEPADLEPVSAGETPIALPQFEPSRPNINNYPAGKQPSSFRLANSVRRANEANSASRQALVNLDDVWAFLGSDDQDSRELLSQELKSANRSAGR